MSGKPPALQANMDRFVKTLGHLLLMKVDPEAAKRRNLPGIVPGEGLAHEHPHHPRSLNPGARESRHGA
jgi:hypothetical protein